MTMEDIHSLTEAISQHEAQLSQVQLAISASTPGPDRDNLISLQSDIEELIKLTKENLSSVQQHQGTNSAAEEKQNKEEDPFAKEYALFKAELENEDAFASSSNNGTFESLSKQTSNLSDIQADLAALQGMKCQAPHSHQWEHTTYHNALIFSVEPIENISSMDQIQVRVMFTNPTLQEMLPCPYFLEGECRFTDEKCRFSHGELVHLSALREYKEPDFSGVQPGARILVKHKDSLWYGAVVQTVQGNSKCEVKFESSGKKIEVDLHDILPLEESEAISVSESSDNDSNDGREEEVDTFRSMNSLLVEQSLMNPPPSTALGDWEKHTKGIGSRLMAQMGYVTGTGLGKFGEGRIEPVEAVVLPAGKSLDHCMELRENAGGDENFFKVEKRLKRLKRRQEMLNKKAYAREKQNTNVFDFINSKLTGKKGTLGQQHHIAKVTKEKSATNGFKSESSRNLNIVGLQVGEEIKRAERDLVRLRESLSRHTPGSQTHTQLISKMENKKDEIQHLKASEQAINQECNQRKDKKKLAVF
ncbi:zinc finger CCCH-type with G patch domain-containing protein [Anabrus simplex]|uniref:zinc finger CCCH-type with G patch domain-containing protein n=1 Tax=Anabrus simplex TaxID=316456 RepID=UPI0035A2B1AF